MSKKSVLFVCLGNICRSPMAEAVFIDLVKNKKLQDQWEIDSAAVIDYHVGKAPEPRTLEVLKSHGITDYKHRVRQIERADFSKFDYIFGMDEDNMEDMTRACRNAKVTAKVELLGKYDPEGVDIIPDPYYHKGTKMFEQVYQQCVRCCEGFLSHFASS